MENNKSSFALRSVGGFGKKILWLLWLPVFAGLACQLDSADPITQGSDPTKVIPANKSEQVEPIDQAVLGVIESNMIPGTSFLRSTLQFALQEDGTGDLLWRSIRLNDKLLYDITTATPYIEVKDGQEQLFGVVFPQELQEVAYGWRDEDGFAYTGVITVQGKRYISIYEIAEKNRALVFLDNGYGDVSYFPQTLLTFMEDNYYDKAEFAGTAWRKVFLKTRYHE